MYPDVFLLVSPGFSEDRSLKFVGPWVPIHRMSPMPVTQICLNVAAIQSIKVIEMKGIERFLILPISLDIELQLPIC